MAPRSRKASSQSQSSNDSDQSEREGTEGGGSDTDLTEPEDEADEAFNADDASLLFADNEYTPEYYIQQLQNFDETVYTQEDYAKGTTALLDRIEEKWSQFCYFIRKDPNGEYHRLSIPILYNFLEWALNLRRGKNGRRLPGIKCKSSLNTFWKVFRLVYERSTSKKIGNQMNRRMRRVIRRLAKKYKLSIKGRDKPPMDVEDLAKVVETTVSTTKKKFGHGRHRIELGLFLQLAGLTTNRPQAILDLRYRHIQVSLLRDPQGGPHRIVIEFTFEFTKEWLGAKDANTYILPEIIFDPSLVLSPHVFLLGLLFADRAFDRVDGEEVLVLASQLPRLQIRDECNELRLQLDPAMDDVPVFRMSERTFNGIGISPNRPLPYSTLEPWVKKMGVITGIRQVTRPYSLRYGAGTALDNSGSVSDSLRNLVMHHADTRTFLKFYLSRRISKNLPAIIRGLDPEEDIMRAACRMSRTIDPDRPQELTTEQSCSVNQEPEIIRLMRQRDEIGRSLERPLSKNKGTPNHDMYRKLNRELAGARKRAQDTLLAQIQNKYDREQPMLEIKRQLSGIAPAGSSSQRLKCSTEVPVPQERLIKSLLTLPRPTIEEEMTRRTEAIDSVAAYCQFQEGDTCRLPRNKRSGGSRKNIEVHGQRQLESEMVDSSCQRDTPLELALRSAMKDHRPLFCFICVGQPDLDPTKRAQQFASHGDVTKHIKIKHLKKMVSSQSIACNICDKTFTEIMHFQRHASDSHKTVTGPLWCAVSS
ncbi:unnamed protein product [Penicillium salamii]|uniref:C2H2-type domain-containing protein n=1 Tax=Penicillium salamii TaxID=1612424 RepID=A0A9W4N0F2_9EURO|nr:unnamed protein product [Penicillium salamii]CAG8094524.1 unnamed protein product [Penicillium salamii]CAG8108593.1 unnamed protein product [Penicillium salamii]CAG8220893.1 unnamed protein product [Penicillium salamii]CAG8227841.1 unnamed protein product [Penicillium salamii]